MMRINLFAMKGDLVLALSHLEVVRKVKYTRMDMLSQPTPEIWNSVKELPRLGFATGDQAVQCDAFLIMDERSSVRVRTQTMLNGIERFDVDQLINPDSVVLFSGGEWNDGTIISGSIATVSKSPIAQALMREAHSGVKKHFTRVRAFWVGPEALAAFRNGRRLTAAIQSPPEFDLREKP